MGLSVTGPIHEKWFPLFLQTPWGFQSRARFTKSGSHFSCKPHGAFSHGPASRKVVPTFLANPMGLSVTGPLHEKWFPLFLQTLWGFQSRVCFTKSGSHFSCKPHGAFSHGSASRKVVPTFLANPMGLSVTGPLHEKWFPLFLQTPWGFQSRVCFTKSGSHFSCKPYPMALVILMPRALIFLRSVLRFTPRSSAARNWLPLVAASAAATSGRSNSTWKRS